MRLLYESQVIPDIFDRYLDFYKSHVLLCWSNDRHAHTFVANPHIVRLYCKTCMNETALFFDTSVSRSNYEVTQLTWYVDKVSKAYYETYGASKWLEKIREAIDRRAI